jgi:hypothetical protein
LATYDLLFQNVFVWDVSDSSAIFWLLASGG